MKLGLDDPTIEDCRAKQRLGDFLHPSFETPADKIEESIRRQQAATEMLLSRYGTEELLQRNEVSTIGELAMYNYGMFASAGRASRAYCLGLRYGQYETVAAGNFISVLSPQILETVLDIKHKRSGIQELQKAVIDRAIDLHRRKLSPFSSVPQSGVIGKR